MTGCTGQNPAYTGVGNFDQAQPASSDLRGADLRGDDLRQPAGPDLSVPADLRGTTGGVCDGGAGPLPDAAAPPTGRKPEPGDIGYSCASSTDCKHGPSPLCWTKTLFNLPGYEATPGGYCTSSCTVDSDCADSNMDPSNPNLCVNFGSAALPERRCVAGCGDAVTCRHPEAGKIPAGYACVPLSNDANGNLLFGCLPDAGFDCNPTVGKCTVANSNAAGACLREAIEDEGVCLSLCTVGGAACPSNPYYSTTSCLFVDFTPGGDDFRGLMCFPTASSPAAPGASCQSIDACGAGYECDVTGTGNCEELCDLSRAGTSCSAGTTCTDVFGTCSGPGLCE